MLPWNEIILRLFLASVFGAAIGLERERKDWVAGLRTHMMVSLGSCLTMMVSAFGFFDILGTEHVELDPSRIAAQVISGIGFIGAGTILFLKQGVVRGLTTASGLWTVAAIGLATGGGMYFAAVVATSLAIVILWILQPLEKKLTAMFFRNSIRVVTSRREKSIEVINRVYSSMPNVTACSVEETDSDFIVSIRFSHLSKENIVGLISELQSDTGIKEVSWGS